MSDTTAKIRGKGLEHTGVTEEHAEKMYANIGGYYKGIVELKVVRHSVDDDGKRTVELAIDAIEIADGHQMDEHLRRLSRAIHYERGLAVNGGDQLPIEGNDEPTVEQVRNAGAELESDETPVLHDDEGDQGEGDESEPDDAAPPADGDDPVDPDDVFNPANQPHPYTCTDDTNQCDTCAGPATWGIHQPTTERPTVPNPFATTPTGPGAA